MCRQRIIEPVDRPFLIEAVSAAWPRRRSGRAAMTSCAADPSLADVPRTTAGSVRARRGPGGPQFAKRRRLAPRALRVEGRGGDLAGRAARAGGGRSSARRRPRGLARRPRPRPLCHSAIGRGARSLWWAKRTLRSAAISSWSNRAVGRSSTTGWRLPSAGSQPLPARAATSWPTSCGPPRSRGQGSPGRAAPRRAAGRRGARRPQRGDARLAQARGQVGDGGGRARGLVAAEPSWVMAVVASRPPPSASARRL